MVAIVINDVLMTDVEVGYAQIGLLIDEVRRTADGAKSKDEWAAAAVAGLELMDAMVAMDQWLSAGGAPPQAWLHPAGVR